MEKKKCTATAAANELMDARSGLSVQAIKQGVLDNLCCQQARFPRVATRNDYYLALAYTVRDRLLKRWIDAAQTYLAKESRTVSYLSAEFLMGPHLGNNLINLGIYDQVETALRELGLDLHELIDQEEEPGLGNGGLGRLAACYLDSLASLRIPAFGYGIRYEFGIFDQKIRDGWQVEVTDKWLRLGNPWEIPRPEVTFDVSLSGRTEHFTDEQGRFRVRWVPYRMVKGVAYDTLIAGYQVATVNLLRLWKAEACDSFDFQAFNVGDYYKAVEQKMSSENITKVLYPNDIGQAGKQLRLEQQYFFASCSLRDMLRIYQQRDQDLSRFHKKFTVQLNDTHPAIAVAELMRLLVDEHLLGWDQAWEITRATFAYTNHTLLPEALEKWPVGLFGRLLPRHLEIICEINHRFLEAVKLKYPGDTGKLERLSLIEETGERYVRMANLACVGSHAINGVAALHTELLQKTVLRDFYELWPEKFSNKTNGVTPRRFMRLANPRLADLITRRIGAGWLEDLDRLRGLEPAVNDPAFRAEWRAVKRRMKMELAVIIRERTGVEVDPDSLFDVQAKRIHEYKRQHLNVLHVLSLYFQLKQHPALAVPSRTFIFAGKAAPGYFMAKRIIKLITSMAEVINNDPDIRGKIKVVFFPDFNVKNAQALYPAADLSEQISTAGKEASGTGNMKFAMNGALTIGTLDGANVEIRQEVGAENFFLFGLTAPEVEEQWQRGYNPRHHYESIPELKQVLDFIREGLGVPHLAGIFNPLVDSLLYPDTYLLLADYQAYIACQERVGQMYLDQERWTKMSILNTARMGKFSSDRSIREYCEDIWLVQSVNVSSAGKTGAENVPLVKKAGRPVGAGKKKKTRS
jgi:starch phosphorylase